MSNSTHTIAQRMLAIRKKLGLSQTDLGRRINYSRTYISMIERGVQEMPDGEFLERIERLENRSERGGDLKEALVSVEKEEELGDERIPQGEFADSVRILSDIYENHPTAFLHVSAMMRGLLRELRQQGR